MSPKPPISTKAPDFERLAGHFRILSEASRLKIIAALKNGEKNVGEIVALTKLSQPNASRHLAILRTGGLLTYRKLGNEVVYKIADATLTELCDLVCRRTGIKGL